MLLERGILVPQGRRKLQTYLDALVISEPVPLGTRIATLIADMRAEGRGLDRRIAEFDSEFAKRAREDDAARRLATIPGIGVLNATALASAVGRAQTFGRGRDRAAWLALVPKQLSTGGKPRLLGISKRGSVYLRKLLIHGARAALPPLSKSETTLGAAARAPLAGPHKPRGGRSCQ